MNFISYNPTHHETTLSPPTELNSIGCEAWIDVSRFPAGEKFGQPIPRNRRASEDLSRSTSAHGSLTKSLALLRKKLRRGSAEGID